jgi:hypothetical protein
MVSTDAERTYVLQWPGDVVAAWRVDLSSVNGQREEIRWDLYPRVGAVAAPRAFVIRLHRFSRRPKTVDAYARNLERFLAWWTDRPADGWVEADEGDLLAYLDDLRNGRVAGSSASSRALPQNVVRLVGSRMAEATVTQHVVALRQFYEYLIRERLRCDPINPVVRGSGRRTGDTVQRGFIRRRGRLPWVAPAEVWERIVLYVVTPRNVSQPGHDSPRLRRCVAT